jgi:hypothetical protein
VTSSNARQLFADLFRANNWADNNWKTKQNDDLDRKTNFIYTSQNFDDVIEKSRSIPLNEFETSYAAHRWKNLRRHDAWLQAMLESSEAFQEYEEKQHKYIDFEYLSHGSRIPFDLKVTRYPNSARANLPDLELAKWYFENQSSEARFHLHNRFFVVGIKETDLYNWDSAQSAIEKFNSRPSAFRHFLELNGQSVRAVILKTVEGKS